MSALRNTLAIIGEPENHTPENRDLPEAEHRAVQAWLKGKSPHTRRSYEQMLMGFIEISGYYTLTEACNPDSRAQATIAAYLDSISGLSRSSIAQRSAALRSLLKECWRWGVFGEGSRGVEHYVPTVNQPPTPPANYPSLEQCLAAIQGEPEPEKRLLLMLLYCLGLRVSEALGLRYEHFIRHESGKLDLWVVGKGRGGGKEAMLEVQPAPEVDAPLLHELGRLLREKAEAQGWKGKLFDLQPRTVQRIALKAWKRAGVTEITRINGERECLPSPHTFRHCHVTHALAAGASADEVRESARHNHSRTTQRYTHLAPENPMRRIRL